MTVEAAAQAHSCTSKQQAGRQLTSQVQQLQYQGPVCVAGCRIEAPMVVQVFREENRHAGVAQVAG